MKDDDSDEDESDSDAEEPVPVSPRLLSKARKSVSAEVYGAWNQQQAFVPPQHPKTADQEMRLRGILSRSILFAALDSKDLDIIVLAMQKCTFRPGERIIQQGDDGDCLYVIEEGSLDCKVQSNGTERVVKRCMPGDVFGELALLYNCPRAASVDSVDVSTAWRLDRTTFNHVARDAALKKSSKYDAFLRKVSLFSSLNEHQRAQVADSLRAEKALKDDVVVRQGEEGDKFYIVEEGTLVALKNSTNGPPKKVMQFSAGDYFGELAMLKDQPRAATIQVTSASASILSMDRDTFKRLLGPLETLMARRAKQYTEDKAEAAAKLAAKVSFSDDEDESDSDAEEPVPVSPRLLSKARKSVSAEVYGAWNQQQAFVPPQHPKTADQEMRLRGILSRSILFAALDSKDLDIIVLAMQKCTFKPGERIIQQGDDGDCLYVIEEGSLDCKVQSNGTERVVKRCMPGDVFGELALLYNCPRAASVDSVDVSTAWRLDRTTFNHVARDAALKKSSKYDSFLRKVSLFSSLNEHQRAQVADSLRAEKALKDDVVVRQGEEGDKFYIVEEGTLVALKNSTNGPPKKVMQFSAGDYFGELAMLKDQPRAATIQVTSASASILSMDRDTFKRLLGPLETLMARRAKQYTEDKAEAAAKLAAKVSFSDDEDESDSDAEEPVPVSPRLLSKARKSVSAEVYGAWNQQQAFVPPQHPKTADQEMRLRGILSRSILFAALDSKDLDIIVLAMQKCTFRPGERIIQQGDDGDCLYVIEEGSLDCKVQSNGTERVVKRCMPGDVFGELALLYNCPRAASVDSVDVSTAWRLDRTTFNHVARDAALKKSSKYDAFLRKVSLFSSLNEHQRAQVADSLRAEKALKDDVVVRQGEEGDKFYIVEEGTLVALKHSTNGPPKKVMQFSAGDYFGELAMLKDQPRAATIQVTSASASILSMDRDTFKRLLGPLESLMTQRSSLYK